MSRIPIKSVRRIFEILELFSREQRPLGAKEIADRLGYPLMSAHALLKSMHALGYADFGNPKWAYTPSRAFLEVLQWSREFHDRDAGLIDFAAKLNAATRETINLSRRVENGVRIFHGFESPQPVGVSVKVGTRMPLTHSLTGLTVLASFDENSLQNFLRKLEKQDPDQLRAFEPELLHGIVADLERQGAVTRCDTFVAGIGAVCVPVTSETGDDPIVLGVVGPSERIRKHEREHRRTLRALARRHGIKTLRPLR